MHHPFHRLARITAATTLIGAGLLAGSGLAAADEWPPTPTEPSPTAPYEAHGFLTPDDPNFWNPTDTRNRLTSPFGETTRIVCTAFHGVTLECWQADREGNPHKLIRQSFPTTGSNAPGGGPSHFVYPG